MTSSGPDTSTRTTGARRAHREARDRGAARTLAQRPPSRYEPHLDGLFTYCLSVLCDHDAATAALADALTLAERRGRHVPDGLGSRRAWLYALARWACLRTLAEARQRHRTSHAVGRAGRRRAAGTATAPAVSEEVRERRRRELAELAWPEAAGTTPEQREALELAVRHHLAAHEVALVLGMEPAAARELLATAACEVERTRAALAVVETGTCPGVAHLTGDGRLVLGTTLRRELVRHVDDCPRCRRTAERAVPGRWPGSSVSPEALPVLPAPRPALHAAMAHHPRARGAAPRFDRRGYPVDPKDRVARRDRLRTRAVTTTVVATVVAAPVFALWAAYRGTPVGEARDGRAASAREDGGVVDLDGEEAGAGYENTGNTGDAGTGPGPRFGEDGEADVSVEVVGVPGAGDEGTAALAVTAGHSGDTTLITLTATGSGPVRWSVSTGASWLYPSRSSGTLAAGESVTIRVHVDQLREPSGHWRATVAISPAGSVVTIDGYGTAPSAPGGSPSGHPGGPGTAHPGTPSDPPASSPGPEPTPTTPAPQEPTPGDPSGSPDPEPTTGGPTPTGSTPGEPVATGSGTADQGDPSPTADGTAPSPAAP
ncbi:hypothetical protein BU52_29260 [Streptomyces toyocaensis]|uniref:BACON domain-containing protein n=1 Tax=Streptomyces toyocaensis TaxID=55952 RepID=A0A081XJH3_STRTO|nr:BACON domain-containing protein [Streptomyces toyocaensis]KES03696.1 hypothetical protein BU52_29260 [Streptomyces toyocaensis]